MTLMDGIGIASLFTFVLILWVALYMRKITKDLEKELKTLQDEERDIIDLLSQKKTVDESYWIENLGANSYFTSDYICKNCGHKSKYQDKFCPNCGCFMHMSKGGTKK